MSKDKKPTAPEVPVQEQSAKTIFPLILSIISFVISVIALIINLTKGL